MITKNDSAFWRGRHCPNSLEVVRYRTRTSKFTPEYKYFCLFMLLVTQEPYWYNELTRRAIYTDYKYRHKF